MSTIEGGMLCTNDIDLYETFRILRSHGMVRERASSDLKQRYYDSYPDLNPDFIFAFPAYNVRNTEIGPIIGRSQLPRSDENNSLRTRNQEIFLNNLNESNFRTDCRIVG
jgi:CDP-4-dehydro-6-deoxyglucose reductase, E1